MSIIDFAQNSSRGQWFYGIGDWIRRNQADIAIVIGFVLVAVIAFGAGRLSAPEIVRNPIIIEEPNASSSSVIFDNVSQPLGAAVGDPVKSPSALTGQGATKGLFVASKSGTKYYWPWCSWVARIKEENKVWFNSEAQAQQAGFSPSVCIPQQAPAGYQKS